MIILPSDILLYGRRTKMPEKKKSTFWADFKKFITRGNVVDMAVGVVVGASFSKIINGLVNYIIILLSGFSLKAATLIR